MCPIQINYLGAQMDLRSVSMDFHYQETFTVETVEAYQRLIMDCLRGDATLFLRRDAVEVAWWLVMPILDQWEASQAKQIPSYAAGSWGPAEADALLASDGREWRPPRAYSLS